MNAKRLSPEKIKQIHNLLDEKKTIKQIMDELGVTKRQVTYQVSFRPKRKTLAEIAKQVGITVDAVNKRKQKGMTNEQIVNHKKGARYEHEQTSY